VKANRSNFIVVDLPQELGQLVVGQEELQETDELRIVAARLD
jgi:hypothetical protein